MSLHVSPRDAVMMGHATTPAGGARRCVAGKERLIIPKQIPHSCDDNLRAIKRTYTHTDTDNGSEKSESDRHSHTHSLQLYIDSAFHVVNRAVLLCTLVSFSLSPSPSFLLSFIFDCLFVPEVAVSPPARVLPFATREALSAHTQTERHTHTHSLTHSLTRHDTRQAERHTPLSLPS